MRTRKRDRTGQHPNAAHAPASPDTTIPASPPDRPGRPLCTRPPTPGPRQVRRPRGGAGPGPAPGLRRSRRVGVPAPEAGGQREGKGRGAEVSRRVPGWRPAVTLRGAAASPPRRGRAGSRRARDWLRGRLVPECSAWRVIEERP